jgi:hypothetical protein
MSQSLLERHLRSTIVVQNVGDKKVASAKEKKVAKKEAIKAQRQPKNYLDNARKSLSSKKKFVDNVIKVLGEKSNPKKFSKSRLRSLIKIQRS